MNSTNKNLVLRLVNLHPLHAENAFHVQIVVRNSIHGFIRNGLGFVLMFDAPDYEGHDAMWYLHNLVDTAKTQVHTPGLKNLPSSYVEPQVERIRKFSYNFGHWESLLKLELV